jgi:hypothetical protein
MHRRGESPRQFALTHIYRFDLKQFILKTTVSDQGPFSSYCHIVRRNQTR